MASRDGLSVSAVSGFGEWRKGEFRATLSEVSTSDCCQVRRLWELIRIIGHFQVIIDTAHQQTGKRQGRNAVLVLAPLAILSGLAVFSLLRDSSQVASQPQGGDVHEDQSTLEIDVTGEEFIWTFRYPGTDGILGSSDDPILSQELVVPLNRRVRLQLKSLDYSYVFEIHPLGIREIAVPDLQYSVEFSILEPMASPLPMDPLCAFGLFQNNSMGRIRADNALWQELIERQ